MAVISGSLGFKRYVVSGKPEADFKVRFEERIKANAFEGFAENDPREEAFGWVSVDDLFDAYLPFDRWFEEGCIRLTLRFDRRKVPARMLKHECGKIEAQWKEKFARERLSKVERDEIKEMVHRTLVARALPESRGVDCYWDLERGEVLFFASAEKANDVFITIFEKTFEVKLAPLFPFALALNLLDERGRAAAPSVPESVFAGGRL